MKGYKIDLPIDKINKKPDKFSDQKNSRSNENYKTWKILNKACVFDELRANILLEKYDLNTESGWINHIIEQNENNYHIPNCRINDPYFERQYKSNIKKGKYWRKKGKIKLFEPMGNINEEKAVTNIMIRKELKDLSKKEHEIGDNFNLKLFFQRDGNWRRSLFIST